MSDTSGKGLLKVRRDALWDKQLVHLGNRGRFNIIDRNFYIPGLMCRINGGEYMFIDTANYWCNLASPELITRVNAVMEITNATVNFEKAIQSYIKYLIKRCNAKVGKPIPTSVCIGVERLEIQFDRDSGTIEFLPCRPLIDGIASDINIVVSTACIMPIDLTFIPVKYEFPGEGTVLQYLIKLFPSEQEFLMVLWVIGNSILDPVTRPKSMMLLGPGGSGKSTLLRILNAALTGCCKVLPDGSLTSKQNSMSEKVINAVVSSRMSICYDVNLEEDPLNMNIFKNISGSDDIRVGDVTCKSNCSLMLATNGRVNIEKQPLYHEDAIMRRVVCITMRVAAMSIPEQLAPDDQDVKIDLICASLYCRLRYEYLPITPISTLITLCGSKLDIALEHLKGTKSPVNSIDGEQVLQILSKVLKLIPEQIIFKAKLMSPYAVTSVHGAEILRGVTTNMDPDGYEFE